ncbi:hypothetical protein IGI04_022202, partial [Brassica rapa subsp. trilocularis]
EDSSLQNHPFERLSVSTIVVGGSSAIPFSLICTIELASTIGAITTLDCITGTVLIPSLDPQVSSIFRWDIVADVESGGIVAEEELQLLNKPNHVSTPEEAENQCGKAGCGQVLHEPFLKFLKHEEEDESEISQDMERLALEYYDPKPVADMLGTIMTNEKVPLHACGGDRTLSGRSLLSSRRYFRRIAWHQDGSMIRQNVIRLKSFRDNKELFSRLTNSRYKPNIASFCKDVLKTG